MITKSWTRKVQHLTLATGSPKESGPPSNGFGQMGIVCGALVVDANFNALHDTVGHGTTGRLAKDLQEALLSSRRHERWRVERIDTYLAGVVAFGEDDVALMEVLMNEISRRHVRRNCHYSWEKNQPKCGYDELLLVGFCQAKGEKEKLSITITVFNF